MKGNVVTGRQRTKNNNRRIARWIVVPVIVLVACIFVFCIFHVVLGKYEGLGEKMSIAASPYSEDCFSSMGNQKSYKDSRYRSVTGIDVSVYQGKIKWKKVRKQGIEFAMIRVGYRATDSGRILEDSRFQENLKGAQKAGLDTGVYFFSQANTVDEAVEEAKYVVRQIRGKGITMPVAFDMEETTGDRISHLTTKQRTEIADAFCTIIQANGYVPMIYGNPRWLLTRINLGYLTRYPVWLAHYTDMTSYPFAFSMWQYSNTAKVKGISRKTDMNIYFIRE
jgi:GH25 family lysozyme M1 (1,4-beta-N-acetylmuramidase)